MARLLSAKEDLVEQLERQAEVNGKLAEALAAEKERQDSYKQLLIEFQKKRRFLQLCKGQDQEELRGLLKLEVEALQSQVNDLDADLEMTMKSESASRQGREDEQEVEQDMVDDVLDSPENAIAHLLEDVQQARVMRDQAIEGKEEEKARLKEANEQLCQDLGAGHDAKLVDLVAVMAESRGLQKRLDTLEGEREAARVRREMEKRQRRRSRMVQERASIQSESDELAFLQALTLNLLESLDFKSTELEIEATRGKTLGKRLTEVGDRLPRKFWPQDRSSLREPGGRGTLMVQFEMPDGELKESSEKRTPGNFHA